MGAISVKYRLYPTKTQETLLEETLSLCRQVYNSLLLERKATYETTGQSLTRNTQNLHLTAWKQKFPELSRVHSQVLQNVSERVDLAYKAFFRRVKKGDKPGFPRFKGAGHYNSITFPQSNKTGCKLDGETLHLSKIGAVQCVAHRPLLGEIKTCTIRQQAGKWFACFACEYEPILLPASSESVGIDVGLEKFAALSDGSFVNNPRFFRKDEHALAKAQRKLAKQERASRARRKARKVVARLHERIRNRRHNFVHQLSRRLVDQYGLIAVEKLNVLGMVQNKHLAKSISDAAWSQFRAVLAYKAESAGRRVVEVHPAYTSQDCSSCGQRAKKTLKERWHHCSMCGLSVDRDTNAAFNILKTAVGTAVGQHSVVGIPA